MRLEMINGSAFHIFKIPGGTKWNISDDTKQDLSPFQLPEFWHYEAQMVRFTGQRRDFSMNFELTPLDSGDDASDGTAKENDPDKWSGTGDDEVLTIWEQRRWLLWYMFNPGAAVQQYLYDQTMFLGQGIDIQNATWDAGDGRIEIDTDGDHSLLTNKKVYIDHVEGMTEINGREFYIEKIDGDEFGLMDAFYPTGGSQSYVDGSTYGAHTVNTGIVYYGIPVIVTKLAFGIEMELPQQIKTMMTLDNVLNLL